MAPVFFLFIKSSIIFLFCYTFHINDLLKMEKNKELLFYRKDIHNVFYLKKKKGKI